MASLAPGATHCCVRRIPEPERYKLKKAARNFRFFGLVPSTRVGRGGRSQTQCHARYGSFGGKNQPDSQRQSLHAACIAISEDVAVEDDEPVLRAEEYDPLPSTFELLTKLCDETSIAELQVKVGSFKLNVKRNVGKPKIASVASPVSPAIAPPPASPKPVVGSLAPESAVTRQSKAEKSRTATALVSSSTKRSSTWALLESAVDEGLLFVKSPKVGYFRRGRVVKGKRGQPLLEEGQVIKEGHVVCYLEQLGTHQPVECEVSGEVVKVLWQDGEPVGYGDPLIAIRPSFPGIKKLT